MWLHLSVLRRPITLYMLSVPFCFPAARSSLNISALPAYACNTARTPVHTERPATESTLVSFLSARRLFRPHAALVLHCVQRPAGQSATGRPERKRRAASYVGAEPSVEEVEAEFWRIVETPDDVYESLYGQVRKSSE